jgi:hypothetical protein
VSAHSTDATSDSFRSQVVVLFLHSVSTMSDVHLVGVTGERNVSENVEAIPRKTNSAVQAAGSIVGTTVVLLGTETVESAPLYIFKLLTERRRYRYIPG